MLVLLLTGVAIAAHAQATISFDPDSVTKVSTDAATFGISVGIDNAALAGGMATFNVNVPAVLTFDTTTSAGNLMCVSPGASMGFLFFATSPGPGVIQVTGLVAGGATAPLDICTITFSVAGTVGVGQMTFSGVDLKDSQLAPIAVGTLGTCDVTVNSPNLPQVTSVSPTSGYKKDPVGVSAEYAVGDGFGTVGSVQYQYSTTAPSNGPTWNDVGTDDSPAGGDSALAWTSGLDEDEVWLRARAQDETQWGEWLVAASSFTIDNTAPTVASAAGPGLTTVTVVFNEEVQQAGAETEGNYAISSTGVTVTDASLGADGKTVTLITSAMVEGAEHTVTVSNVVDLAGNVVGTPNSATFTVQDQPRVTAANFVDYTHADVVFSKQVTEASAEVTGNYAINPLEVSGAELQGDGKTVRLTTAVQTQGQEYTVTVSNVEDAQGRAVNPEANSASWTVPYLPVVSAVGPTSGYHNDPVPVTATYTDGDGVATVASVQYQYSTVAPSNGATWNDVGTDDSPADGSSALAWTSGLDAEVWLQARAQDERAWGPWFTAETSFTIDNTAPTVASADSPELTTVEVEFSEEVQQAGAETEGNYAISSNGVTVTAAALGADNKTVTLTTSEMVEGAEHTVTVSNVVDLAGNVVGTPNSATFTAQDKPRVDAANYVDSTHVDVVFSKQVTEASAEVTENYAINPLAVSGAELQADGKTVRLTTATQTEGEQYTVTVSNVEDAQGRAVNPEANSASWTAPYLHTFAANADPYMVGIPLENPSVNPLSLADADDMETLLGGAPAAWWDPTANSGAGGYITLTTPTPFELGCGYWARFDNQADVEIYGNAASGNVVYGPLQGEAWNIISPPYLQAIGFGNLAGPILQLAWTDQGSGYQLVAPFEGLNDVLSSFEPWQSYWVWATATGNLTYSETAAAGQVTTLSVGAEDGDGWLIQLVAKAGQRVDSANWCGVGSEELVQTMAIPNPPLAQGSVDLYFTGAPQPMAAEVKSAADSQGLEWEFEVATDMADVEVQIAYPDLSVVPRQYQLTLDDLDGGKAVNMRTGAGYTYRTSGVGSIRHFKITASAGAGGVLTVSNVVAQQAGSQSAAITYTLSAPADVTVEIRNISGRLIRAIAAAAQPAGISTATWDLRNAAGSQVPSGPYLCIVTACSDSGDQVSAVRTLSIRR